MISTLSSGLTRSDLLTRTTAPQAGPGASKYQAGNAAQAASTDTSAAGNPFLNISEEVLQNMKGAEETSNFLQKAAEKAEDDDRGMRIEQLRQKIEFLKERLKFATPERAKALLRELKQIAKEFKQAAKSLSDGGMSMMAGVAGVGPQNPANATGAASEAGVEAGVETATAASNPAVAATADGPGNTAASSPDLAQNASNAPPKQNLKLQTPNHQKVPVTGLHGRINKLVAAKLAHPHRRKTCLRMSNRPLRPIRRPLLRASQSRKATNATTAHRCAKAMPRLCAS
ncbi:hypothetical protein JM93_03223 [Roseibium hamelinense]|uniref:Uncharacterized protein n=1 Tax=Roseibium hamelinense TaxID=150831 RepID=A0A562SN42_9HYPH|nr:hypothetical protein [Roseibium hamelinense]MTI44082.1 hypothetical protein [Roseibium hamelinense]TWI82709.1 hypothetical protein JM93_03223 [Roseibium hamelinense]